MITFNGVSLDTFSAHVFRIDTDTAPARVLDPYAIEGRSGDLLMDRKRYKNVVMTYRVVLYGANADSNFRELKNFLMSQIGYKRLTDTEHPDEFYLAYVSGDIVPELTENRDKIKFELEFTRKPQRYLLSGEAETVIGVTHEISGHIISVDAVQIDSDRVEFDIAIPFNNGTPTSPTNIDGYNSIGFKINGETEYYSEIAVSESGVPIRGHYSIASAYIDLLNAGNRFIFALTRPLPTTGWSYSNGLFTCLAYGTDIYACSHYKLYFGQGTRPDASIQFDNGYYKIKDSRFTGAFALTQFNNWISGLENPVKVICEEEYNSSQTATIEVDAYTPDFPTAGQVELETDEEYQKLVIGYYSSEFFNNPTAMLAKPYLKVSVNQATGGSFSFNDDTVTISSGVSDVIIDSEMQDCYYGSSNLNDKVSFAPTYDFPTLAPGENRIVLDEGIYSITIKPRWWSI